MSKNEWIRLNVGGKIFQTTKHTLSAHSQSFLTRLMNEDLPSEKDETGAYLVDRDPKHFSTILNYVRSGLLIMDENKKAMKGLVTRVHQEKHVDNEISCEADFYGIQSLVDEIHKALKMQLNRTEMIIISYIISHSKIQINMSETQEDYEVLQALRQKLQPEFSVDIKKGFCQITHPEWHRGWTIMTQV